MFSCKLLLGPLMLDKKYEEGETVCLGTKDKDTLLGLGLIEVIAEVEPKFIPDIDGDVDPVFKAAPVEAIETPVVEAAPVEAIETPVVEAAPVEAIETPVVEVAPVEAIETPVVEVAPVEAIETPVVEAAPVAKATRGKSKK
jgi:hypothetical protein